MIGTNNISVRFGQRTLYKEVNIKFTNGNCYGLIGANGAGKSTFLKVLSGELQPDTGEVYMGSRETLFTLKQDHFAFDDEKVINVVLRGNEKLYAIMEEKDALYAKADFSDEDGERAGHLEAEFAELDGWNAESQVAILLNGLGIDSDYHEKCMKELTGSEKVKVLLAQALFSGADTLLLDEPTNGLDIKAISWLEHFLINYEHTVIVVSHDRHFLNKVCTHIADVDFGEIRIYSGNYDFWYESSQLMAKQLKDVNRKKEDKIKELEDFIARFSANASKSKQATSRKKILDKIVLDDLKPSTRRYPFIDFKPTRESGKQILNVEGISKSVEGVKLLDNISFSMLQDDKIALIGNPVACTMLLKIINNEVEADIGEFNLGQTITPSYIPMDNSKYFENEDDICTWLSRYTDTDDMSFIRGFLGRMLFTGEEALKPVKVLSGGEKARCMLSKAMLESPNLVMLDDPTNHLDLEAITSLNDGLINTKAELLFTSHDHQFLQTIANRILVIREDGTLGDYRCTYDEYLEKELGIEE
ncbi:ATP-binding cassette domain-containing protein [Anaerorhabdus sp.]|uniref:ABC-F family ATP-binding cassette domain-containing protein n=1 Tax=Anaerorhabdus sp. TaxID=1872524 RepID=UPI002B220C8C|nr:ATP-binding cassette domain-containing protein [Anaerorhabdus sp.]MEA4875628.1 ATP-binding cassette domain-containing protein [Anaerorhabdus sp.]